jgi:hypothetical protein
VSSLSGFLNDELPMVGRLEIAGFYLRRDIKLRPTDRNAAALAYVNLEVLDDGEEQVRLQMIVVVQEGEECYCTCAEEEAESEVVEEEAQSEVVETIEGRVNPRGPIQKPLFGSFFARFFGACGV